MTTETEKKAKPDLRIGGASDIGRFYYKNSAVGSKRSSLSLDVVLVELLTLRFGDKKRVRKWVSAQARLAHEAGLDAKSVSRAVQENALRLIADPALIEQLPAERLAEYERQQMMANWLGQGQSSSSKQSRRL